MKPEAQRIAIAQACGWTECQHSWHPGDVEGRKGKLWLGIAPINKGQNFEIACWSIPDYLNDLNAMHEAEKTLREMQTMTYVDRLGEIVSQGMGDGSYGEVWNMNHATATQRAEAFLKTLNLWKQLTIPHNAS